LNNNLKLITINAHNTGTKRLKNRENIFFFKKIDDNFTTLLSLNKVKRKIPNIIVTNYIDSFFFQGHFNLAIKIKAHKKV